MLKSYVENGWLHVKEAKILLPKVMFDFAKKESNLVMMREYLKNYPNHESHAEGKAFVTEQYKNACDKLTQNMERDTAAFFRNLFKYLELNESPPVMVYFRPPSTEALNKLDTYLASKVQSPKDNEFAPIADSFRDSENSFRENTIFVSLKKGFSEIVSEQILQLRSGYRLNAEKTIGNSKPAMEISYTINPSGSIFSSTDATKTRRYVGIEVDFEIKLTIPNYNTPLVFTVTVEPPEHFKVHSVSKSYSSVSDTRVYDTMAKRAFDKLNEDLSRAFFEQKKEKDQQGVSNTTLEEKKAFLLKILPSLFEHWKSASTLHEKIKKGEMSEAQMDAIIQTLEEAVNETRRKKEKAE